MFRKPLIGLGALFGVVLALITAQIAFAHSRPIRFDPAPGAVLSSAPSQITGWFTNPLRRDPNWNFIRVSDAQGAVVSTGDINLSTDRRQMSVALRPGLANGRYLVTWRSWDDVDGQIFGDCYTFYVGQSAAEAGFNDKTRLDGGGTATCARIDVSTRDGTPVPGVTPTATAAGDEGHDDEADHADSGSSGSDVPVWGLAVGVIGGAIVGGVGGRLLGSRP